MALSKKQKSYLLVAILAGGTIIGEGIGLYNLNNNIKDLHNQKTKLENNIESLNEDLKEQTNKLNKQLENVENLTKEKEDLNNSLEKIKEENKSLKNQLNAKKEVSAKTASADYPTQSISRGTASRGTPVTITLTFYGDGADENGGYAGLNAYSQKLSAGMVASNVYPRGTQFQLPSGQILEVQDKGGSHFNSYNRLDVFVPRLSGESDDAYARRISKLGRKTITMYKLN